MDFHCLPIFFSLSLMLMATHAALPPELYWKCMLPSTPMPKAITELLSRGHIAKPAYDGQNAHMIEWGQSADTETQLEDQLLANWKNAADETQLEDQLLANWKDAAEETQLEDQLLANWKNEAEETQLHDKKRPFFRQYGAEETQLLDGLKAQSDMRDQQFGSYTEFDELFYGPTANESQSQIQNNPGQISDTETVSHNDANSPLLVKEPAAGNHQLHDHPIGDLFFLQEDLRPGTKMNLHFSKSKNASPLLPRQITEPIPFSLDQMTEVLNKFSVKPMSKKAEIIEKTIRYCEEPALEGEEKFCAASLESLVDFITSKLGKNVHALSTEVENEIKLQKFSVKDGVKELAEDDVVACHRFSYPYAVLFCHKLMKTSAYFVPLEGEDGTRVKAVAVCHRDTSHWDPKHLAFHVLKVKPGTVPVCHFSPESNVVWLPK